MVSHEPPDTVGGDHRASCDILIGRIAVEKNVQALIDAIEHLDESLARRDHRCQYVPPERLGPRIHLLPAQRRIGNWLGMADVLCQPSDYESRCFSINEAWLVGGSSRVV